MQRPFTSSTRPLTHYTRTPPGSIANHSSGQQQQQRSYNIMMKVVSGTLIAVAAIILLCVTSTAWTSRDGGASSLLPWSGGPVIVGDKAQLLVFLAIADDEKDNHVVRKNIEDLKYQQEASNGRVQVVVAASRTEQLRTMERSCPKGVAAFKTLVAHKQEHLAREMWKYCVLKQNDGPARLYVDASSPLLVRMTDLLTIAGRQSNLAVLGEEYLPKTIHGSLLLLQPNQQGVAEKMLFLLIDTSVDRLSFDPLLLPRTLYETIASDSKQAPLSLGHNGNWYLLEQICHVDPLRRLDGDSSWTGSESYRLNHACPLSSGFCCAVRNGLETTILLTRHPILPYQTVSQAIPRPYNAEAGHFEEEELPYMATIQERVFEKPEKYPRTPNFFDILLENDCLPDGSTCSKCLREKSGANCQSCAAACPCYCKALCREEVEKKFVAKELTITPPLYSRDPDRLIPRIIHQTYFEPLSKTKYPNMSRLVESFKRSGWDYRFYSDEDAQNFLSTHFPAEVRQAYDALRPGAFKADLFRYCALLIHGGVYADVDIMLGKSTFREESDTITVMGAHTRHLAILHTESALDESIPKNVGFVVPVDEPGIEAKRPCCVRQCSKPITERKCWIDSFVFFFLR